jgi:hypothetical protein
VRKFTTTECEDFLRLVDAELPGPCQIVLIGGGAVALKYKGSHATTDLDLWSVSEIRQVLDRANPSAKDLDLWTAHQGGFWEAVERVNASAAEPVPVQKATIAEPPYSFEDRLIPLTIKGLKKLTVLVPERHDLVVMKVARGEAHDLDAIEDIHRAAPLSFDILIERYVETTTQVMGNKEMHRLNAPPQLPGGSCEAVR